MSLDQPLNDIQPKRKKKIIFANIYSAFTKKNVSSVIFNSMC